LKKFDPFSIPNLQVEDTILGGQTASGPPTKNNNSNPMIEKSEFHKVLSFDNFYRFQRTSLAVANSWGIEIHDIEY